VNFDNFISFLNSDTFDYVNINQLNLQFLILFGCSHKDKYDLMPNQAKANQLLVQSSGSREKND
jgi:hypothetical protein